VQKDRKIKRNSSPAEEFILPLGEGNGSHTFLRIGNGVYVKPETDRLLQNGVYEPVLRFPWVTERKPDRIRFLQDASAGEYGYRYEKCLSIPPGKVELKIEYRLKNTGKKRIRTKQYAHNFISFDNRLFPGIRIEFTFVPKLKTKRKPPFRQNDAALELTTCGISYSNIENLRENRNNRVRIHSGGYDIEIIENDHPAEQGLYTGPSVLCPESYITVDLLPGESKCWKRIYRILQ